MSETREGPLTFIQLRQDVCLVEGGDSDLERSATPANAHSDSHEPGDGHLSSKVPQSHKHLTQSHTGILPAPYSLDLDFEQAGSDDLRSEGGDDLAGDQEPRTSRARDRGRPLQRERLLAEVTALRSKVLEQRTWSLKAWQQIQTLSSQRLGMCICVYKCLCW